MLQIQSRFYHFFPEGRKTTNYSVALCKVKDLPAEEREILSREKEEKAEDEEDNAQNDRKRQLDENEECVESKKLKAQ